jgi:hypothetical protein
MKKVINGILLGGVILGLIVYSFGAIKVQIEYSNEVEGYWHLADRASDLSQKYIYIKQFYEKLDEKDFAENGSVMFPRQLTSFQQNKTIIKSLLDRLYADRNLLTSNWAYSREIEQITKTEQEEAGVILMNLGACWYLKNHPEYWGWYGALLTIAFICLILIFLLLLAAEE